MIKLKDVSKYYYQDGVIAAGFSRVNLEFNIGEFVVITGESGSGKSSLLNVLSGLDSYEEGEMYINGEETSHYTENDYLNYRKKYVTNIFQNFNLVNSYTVYQNIELALLVNGKSKKEVKRRVLELISLVGLTKFKNTKASKLSGGQKQRVAIARALAYDTPIIVADEPTGSLDSKQSKNILELLHKVSENKLVIVVTHNKDEIEAYATRLIRMHDGKIIENKVVKQVNKDNIIDEKEINDITFGSKIRLGVRNTFNLPVKFMLLLFVFFFVGFSLVNEYAGMEQSKYNAKLNGYNNFFKNTDERRIIIKKKDKSIITNSDLAKIKELNNVSYINEEDIVNDASLNVYDNNNFYFWGSVKSLNDITKVNKGRLPQKKNEVIVRGAKDDYYLKQEEIFDSTYVMENNDNGYKLDEGIKVVGIIYASDMNYGHEFLVTDDLMKSLNILLLANNSTTKININDMIFMSNNYDNLNRLIVSDLVKKGEVILSSELNINCPNYDCLNKYIDINVNNLYYNTGLKLNVSGSYNKNNFKELTGFNKFEEYNGAIFINSEDYNNLYDRGTYQSSVFVKDAKIVAKTANDLNNLGYETLNLKDALYDEAQMVNQMFNIFKLIVTIILLITLFFISYFVIKIILKSRNSYFATIRSLGADKRVSIELLIIELFTVSTLGYIVVMSLVSLINNDIIKYNSFKEMLSFVRAIDYVLIYILIILMTILISLRYARKLFKSSVIKNYGERI